jgi:ABC-type Fe3+-hydroxamate transport system substrate-binding protein
VLGTRLKQRRSFDRGELSRLKSSLLRARTITKRVGDEDRRDQLENKLDRLIAALKKITPKRGVSVIALEEASRLVSKIVNNRDQAQKLIEALRRLSG